MVREGRVFTSTVGKPAFGSGLMVSVLAPGAQVTQGSVSTTITVAAGHGFAAGDKYMVGTDLNTYSGSLSVISVTATTLELEAVRPVASGDLVVNMGADTGIAAPNYDGNGVTVYIDPDYQNAFSNGLVWADANGRYRYHHRDIPRWELVRSASAPIAIYIETIASTDRPVSYEVRYAHMFATSGAGTFGDPWLTAGSNPVQAAYDDLPASGEGGGGRVRMVPGVYELTPNANGNGLEITNPSAVFSGVVLEGYTSGNRGDINYPTTTSDGAVLLYNGSKAAIKIGHWATDRSYWAEHCELRNFKILQAGTNHAGIGILSRLLRFSTVYNVTVNGFSTGVALSGVSDFNQFDRLTVHDPGTYGVDIGRANDENDVPFGALAGECNANRFYNCDIAGEARDNGVEAWGIIIQNNSVACVIKDSEFHNFNTTGGGYGGYGAIFSSSTGFDNIVLTVENNYFEGNYHALLHNNSAGVGRDCHGVHFLNNYVSQIEGYGVRINSGQFPGGYTKGTVIQGNLFYVPTASLPYDNAIGVNLGTNVLSTVLIGNVYLVEGPAPTYIPQTYTLPGGNVVTGLREMIEIVDDTITWRGQYQAKMVEGSNSEEITLSTVGLTTDSSANLLPANSLVLGVTARITQTITAATNWALGDSAQAARFTTASSSLAAGATAVGMNHLNPTVASSDLGTVQVSAAPLRVTCTGSNPGAGKIRVTVFYRTFSAATS